MAQPRRTTAKSTAAAQASPFSAKGTVLRIPASVAPGTPFSCDLTVSNETDDRLTGAFVEIQHSPNARLMEGTVAVNGRTLSRSLVRSTEGRVSVKLPTMPPRSEAHIAWDSLVDVPADNGSKGSLVATVSATGASLGTTAEFTVASSVEFAAESSHYKIEGDATIAVGEKRLAHLYIVNDGTMTARSVELVLAGGDFELLGVDFADELLPGDPRTVVATVELVSEAKRPVLEPVLKYEGGSYKFPEFAFVRTEGPKFTSESSLIERTSEEPLAPSGGRIVVAVTLHNAGERPGQPTVALLLPDHARALFSGEATNDATISFRRIEPGESETQEIIIEVAPCDSLEIGALVDDQIHLTPLVVQIERQTSLVPMNFGVTDDPNDLRVEEPFGVHLELFSESNATIERATFGLDFGPSLSYVPGTLTINGNNYPDTIFATSRRLAFKNVDFGAVISLDWQVVASRPTLRGAVTTLDASIAWEGQQQRAELGGISIAPRALSKSFEELPFSVADVVDEPVFSDARATDAFDSRSGVDAVAAAATTHGADTFNGRQDNLEEEPADEASRAAAALSNQQGTIEDELAKLGNANFRDVPPAAAPQLVATGGTGVYVTNYTPVAFDPRNAERMRGLWATLRQDFPNAFGQIAALYSLVPESIDPQGPASVYENGYTRLSKLIKSVLMRASMEDRPQARPADIEAFCYAAAPVVKMMPPDFLNRFSSWNSERPSFSVCFATFATFAGGQFETGELSTSAMALSQHLIATLAQHDDVAYTEWPALLQDAEDEEAGDLIATLTEQIRQLDAVAA